MRVYSSVHFEDLSFALQESSPDFFPSHLLGFCRFLTFILFFSGLNKSHPAKMDKIRLAKVRSPLDWFAFLWTMKNSSFESGSWRIARIFLGNNVIFFSFFIGHEGARSHGIPGSGHAGPCGVSRRVQPLHHPQRQGTSAGRRHSHFDGVWARGQEVTVVGSNRYFCFCMDHGFVDFVFGQVFIRFSFVSDEAEKTTSLTTFEEFSAFYHAFALTESEFLSVIVPTEEQFWALCSETSLGKNNELDSERLSMVVTSCVVFWSIDWLIEANKFVLKVWPTWPNNLEWRNQTFLWKF